MDSQITLPQQVRGKGNIKSSQSAIKLIEVSSECFSYMSVKVPFACCLLTQMVTTGFS